MKFKLIKMNSVTSTNDQAIKLIRKNKVKPCIIVAKKQSKGRGTMGKKWTSRKGNLFMSLFFEFNLRKIKPNGFSSINPYIIRNILSKYSIYKIIIKWPNDLLVKNRKLCGILQEVIEYKNRKFLIIGIGINTKVSPKVANLRTISLLSCSNHIIKNNEILIKIKLAYEKIISGLRKGKISYLKRRAY